MPRRSLIPLLLLLLNACAPPPEPQSRYRRPRESETRRRRAPESQTAGSFDYYLLALSYAPDFCDESHGNRNSAECGAGRQTGFVVHGLWPQAEGSRGPQHCGPASPVSASLVSVMLNYFPTVSLIQHEWSDHGTCTGLSAPDYFGLVRQARDSVTIPSNLRAPLRPLQLDPQSLEQNFAAANPRFPAQAFRVSCYPDGELREIRICFDPNLSPRRCSVSAGSCVAPVVTLLPVR